MKQRNTFVLLFITCALLAFIIVQQRRNTSTREAVLNRTLALCFEPQSVDSITIKNNDETIELQLKDGEWRIGKPVSDRADQSLVSSIVSAASLLEKTGSVHLDDPKENKARQQLKNFGLQKPKLSLRFSGRERITELFFGKDTAVEGRVYVRLDRENAAHAVPDQLRKLVSQPVDSFRDRKLYAARVSRAVRFNIKTALGEIEMAKDGEHWEIRKPVKVRGDDNKINVLISEFINLPITDFATDTKGSSTGLSEPRGTLTLFTEDSPKPALLEIGQVDEKDPNKIYAHFPLRDSFYKLPRAVENLLAIKPNDVRDTALSRLETDIVDRVTIEPMGKPPITLIRKQDYWLLKGDPAPRADRPAAERLLGSFVKSKVVSFVDDVASDLPKYGLDHPSLKVTFSSYSSENTPESAAGERPFLSVLFGKTDGDRIFALVEDEPFVVAVSRNFLNNIHADEVLWRDRQLSALSPEDITSIKVTSASKGTKSFARMDDSRWKIENGAEEPDDNAIESIASTLARLHAVRRVSDSEIKASKGLEAAPTSINFTTKDGKEYQLLIGSADEEEMFYASLNTEPGGFTLSRPDVEVLKGRLVKAAAPSAGSPSN